MTDNQKKAAHESIIAICTKLTREVINLRAIAYELDHLELYIATRNEKD